MLRHPVFPGIVLHTDDELSEALDVKVTGRKTVHEWPLSCVQEIYLADGSHLAYKSQLPPTVESQFYEQVSPGLLPGHLALGTLGACDTMVMEWISSPLLRDTARAEADVVKHGRRLVAMIGELTGDLPSYLDIGSPLAWSALCASVFGKLDRLVTDRRFDTLSRAHLQSAHAWANAAETFEALAESRIIHGDLKPEQVFVTGDGYRVIDWQRPVVAPPEIDLVSLLAHVGIDPVRHVDTTIVRIYWFLRLQWAVEAQHDLFPQQRSPLFNQWAAEAVSRIVA